MIWPFRRHKKKSGASAPSDEETTTTWADEELTDEEIIRLVFDEMSPEQRAFARLASADPARDYKIMISLKRSQLRYAELRRRQDLLANKINALQERIEKGASS